MICCKIVSDFNHNFQDIFSDLAQHGDILWNNGSLFFANVENEEIDEKKIKRILKKHKCSNYYLNIYSKESQPQETDSVNGWLYDHIIKINYREYENHNQRVFRQMSLGLDALISEIQEKLELEKKEDGEPNVKEFKEQEPN